MKRKSKRQHFARERQAVVDKKNTNIIRVFIHIRSIMFFGKESKFVFKVLLQYLCLFCCLFCGFSKEKWLLLNNCQQKNKRKWENIF